MKRFLLALTFIFLALPALAQALNPPQWATGYINVAAGTTVTTNVTNSFTAPTNLNITAGGAITTWNVRMPSPAFDGQLITIACPYGNVATLNVTAVAPNTVQSGGPTSCTSTPGQAVVYQYFQFLAQWTVLSTGTSPGGSGTMGMVNIAAGTNITLSGSCNSPTTINCTINTPASMGSVAVVAGTNITLSGTCTGTASINCTVNAAASTAYTAGATGGLTLTGTVFSLGGDSGNVVYTSPGQLQLGKSGTAGTLAIGNATSGLLTLKAAAGALGANSITFPITGGVIAANAFLGVGSGLTSSAGNLILGDSHLNYQTGTGGTIWTAVDNTLGSGSLRVGWQFGATFNGTTVNTNGFADQVGMYLPIFNNVGQNVFAAGEQAKTTFISLFLNTTDIAAGQRIGFQNHIFCYGMGDCGTQNDGVQFGGGPINGDEGQNFSATQYLQQQPFLTKATIASIPAQTLCNTTTTSNIVGSSAVQTANVVDATNCNLNDWIVVNASQPDTQNHVEAVKLAPGPGGNTITGVFRSSYNVGWATALGTITPGSGGTDGTYNAVNLTGGTCTLAPTATIVVSGGAVITVTEVGQGHDCTAGDVLTASPGGVTGFTIPVATVCCGPWTITPAVVLNLTNAGSFGEQRVLVNHTQPSYSTGQAAGGGPGVGGALLGIGTTWATNMLTGGTSLNEGCITMAADDYTGTTISNGSFTTPLSAWYEIGSVTSPTQLSIVKTTVAGDGSYAGNGQYASFTGAISGVNLTASSIGGYLAIGEVLQTTGPNPIAPGTTIVSGSGSAWVVSISQSVGSEAMVASTNTNVGLGTGAYVVSPCARMLRLNSSQVILETNSFTWTVGDSVEQVVSPYSDVHGINYTVVPYLWGGAYRDVIEIFNEGARTMTSGLTIKSFMQSGGGASTVGFQSGIQINNSNIGISMGLGMQTAMVISTATAPICWGTTTGFCFGEGTALGGGGSLMITMTGGALTTNGAAGALWAYAPFASNALNPINNPMATIEVGGNFIVKPVVNTETTLATAATIGFDPGFAGPFEAFRFGNSDGIGETVSAAAQKLLVFSTNGIHMYGFTGGSDPTGSNSSLGTVTIFEGVSEAELALSNAPLTQNVTFTVSAAGVLTIGGNGSGSSNGGIIVGAETVNSFAGAGSRPVCVTSTGVLEVGSLSAGLVTCP